MFFTLQVTHITRSMIIIVAVSPPKKAPIPTNKELEHSPPCNSSGEISEIIIFISISNKNNRLTKSHEGKHDL